MKVKSIVEKVLKNSIKNIVEKPSASLAIHGLEKMPESMKKAR